MTVWVQIPGDPPVYNCNNISSHNPTCKIQGQWRSGITPLYALVAQLAEALGLGPRGWGFESLAAHHFVGLFHVPAYVKEYAPPCRKVRLELIQMVAKNSLILLQANGLNRLATDQILRVRILLGVPIGSTSSIWLESLREPNLGKQRLTATIEVIRLYLWDSSPTGRGVGFKLRMFWVRIPGVLPFMRELVQW